MNQNTVNSKRVILCAFFGLALSLQLCAPYFTLAATHPLLIKNIIKYNKAALEKSLMDDSYRGEEGILRVKPEIAKAMGMNVFIDQDYLDSRRLFERAENNLEEAKRSMALKQKGRPLGDYAKDITDHFLLFKKNSKLAREKLKSYRKRLNPGIDDRLNKAVSNSVMGRLLGKSLKETDNRLRDALGYFYNVCQGLNENSLTLTPENVRFVNYVFHRFIGKASIEDLSGFELDRDYGYKNDGTSHNWQDVAGKNVSHIIPLLEVALKRSGDEIYDIDPLLFIALMRRESNFNPHAISHVGAVGLTQIMPKTAIDMGMKNIHMPAYFDNAISLMKRERKTRDQAMAALFQINETNGHQFAKEARELMQASLVLGQKRKRLFIRYKKEILKKRTDDRLQPAQAIAYGLKYFAKMMKKQKGDISLALASYNAGPHRIQEFEGIPPYEETVRFRNWVLKYYRDYLRKAKKIL